MQHTHHHLLAQVRQSTLLRFLTIASLFVSGCAVLFLFSRSTTSPLEPAPAPHQQTQHPPNGHAVNSSCYVDLDLLRSHGYNTSVHYARLDIAVRRKANFSGFPGTLDTKLPASRPLPIDAYPDDAIFPFPDDACAPALTISAPPAPSHRPDASHMLFGVSTSLERLLESLPAFAHWAAGTNARIIALTDEGAAFTDKVRERATQLDVRLTIIEADDERLDRYFTLVKVLYEQREPATQWGVLIDDDTFFPSMARLVERFRSYDASQKMYVGGVSEDLHQLYMGSYMAFGGAGIFLTVPLLERLNEVFEDCYEFKGAGDRMVAHCVYAHTETKLTWDRELHQLDLHGDASGFYESGRALPLSVHHWKSWSHVDMVALVKVARVCGEEGLLRRWRLSDGWFLVNGFSVIRYDEETGDEELRAMEQTWHESQYPGWDAFGFNLGPVRKKDAKKESLRLVAARVEERGGVRQVYVDGEGGRVVEVVWREEDRD